MRFLPVLVLFATLTFVASSSVQPAKTQRLDFNGDALPDGAVARLGTLRFQSHGSRYDGATLLLPDGTAICVQTYDKDEKPSIELMDTSTGKIVRKSDLEQVEGSLSSFTSNGESLVFRRGSTLTLVDRVTGKITKSINVEGVREPLGFTFAAGRKTFAFTSDTKWVAAQLSKNDYDAPVGIWDMMTGKQVALLPGRGAVPYALAFGPDGKRLLLWSIIPTSVSKNGMSYGGDSKVALVCIDVAKSKIVGDMTIIYSQQVALFPDGETVAVEDADHQCLRVRHLPTGAERCIIHVKHAKFALAPDGKVLLTIDKGGQAVLWDTKKGEKIRDLEGPVVNEDFRIVGISNDGKTIAVLDGGWRSDPIIVVWNAVTGKRVARPPGHEGTITCLGYTPGGKLLISGSLDKTVRLWNAVTGEHLRKLAAHKEAITALAISFDGKIVASCSQDGAIQVFNIADGKVVAELDGPTKGANAMAFSPDGKVLFAGGREPEVLAWEIAGAKEIARLKTGDDGAVLAFAEGGAWALTANGEIRAEGTPERLQLWNPFHKVPAASITLRNEKGGHVRCDAAIISPASRMLVSSQVSEYQGIRPSYGNALLRLWERTSGQQILTLAPTITQVLAFSPNGRLLASGGAGNPGHLFKGYGGGVDIWDTVTGKKAGELKVTPQCLAFSPDGLHLATGGSDHCVVIWQAPKIPSPKKGKAPSAAQRDTWWGALGGDAKDAYKTIGQMLDNPEHAVALLKVRVQPVKLGDPAEVAKFFKLLDSEKFAEREKAQAALEKMGEGAADLVMQALQGNITLELRRRLELVLSKCNPTSILGLQQHRAVATLEWIGTPAARDLLRTLADGAPGTRLTAEASAAWKRLLP